MSDDDVFPAYRDRYLPALSAAEIEALPDKAATPVIIPTGAIEQHGPHLPVGVDAMMGQVWLHHALPKLPPRVKVWVAPPITVGKSNEHLGFPGTLMISATELQTQLSVMVRQLHAWGFRVFGILNTHGGNTSVLLHTLRELHTELGVHGGMLAMKTDLGISAQEAAYGFHAGEVETSWLAAEAPELCRLEDARTTYPASVDDERELLPELAPATYSWITADISPTGIMGDATTATATKGERWIDQMSAALAGNLAALHTWAAQHATNAANTSTS